MQIITFGKIAASAAVIQDAKILLLRRSPDVKLFPDHWTFPSGGIEETDLSVNDAVTREVKEETNLDFTPAEKFGFYESIVDCKRCVALVHIGTWSGEIILQESEIREWRWFSYKETKGLNLAFAYRQVIDDLKKQEVIK